MITLFQSIPVTCTMRGKEAARRLSEDLRSVLTRTLEESFRRVPHVCQQWSLEFFLNLLFSSHRQRGDLDFMEGHHVAIEMEDLNWRWPISIHNRSIQVLRKASPAETVIRSRFPDLLALIFHETDPDTLFFNVIWLLRERLKWGLVLKISWKDYLLPNGQPLFDWDATAWGKSDSFVASTHPGKTHSMFDLSTPQVSHWCQFYCETIFHPSRMKNHCCDPDFYSTSWTFRRNT